MIHFACNRCGASFKVSDDKGGKKAKCAKCGAVIVIPLPSATGSAALDVVPLQTVPPGSAGKGWVAGNLRWLVLGAVGFVLVVGLIVVAMLASQGGLMTDEQMDDYIQAKLEGDLRVQERIGTPLTERASLYMRNSISAEGDQEQAYEYIVQGPKGTARVLVELVGRNEKWRLRSLKVGFEDGDMIVLAGD